MHCSTKNAHYSILHLIFIVNISRCNNSVGKKTNKKVELKLRINKKRVGLQIANSLNGTLNVKRPSKCCCHGVYCE